MCDHSPALFVTQQIIHCYAPNIALLRVRAGCVVKLSSVIILDMFLGNNFPGNSEFPENVDKQ